MNKIKVYANYGVLGAEKRVVYSEGYGEIYDTVTLILPEGWKTIDLVVGKGLESPWGEIFQINEAIRSINDEPWIDVKRIDNGEIYRKKLARGD